MLNKWGKSDNSSKTHRKDTMMRVLFFTETAYKKSETFIKNQINNPHLFDKIIVTHEVVEKSFDEGKVDSVYHINSIPITFIDRVLSFISRKLNRTKRYSLPYSSLTQLENIIKKENISLIHCNYGNNAIKIIKLAKKLNIPIITHFHGYDSSQLLKDTTYFSLIKKVFKDTDATITVSQNMTNRLTEIGLDLKKNHIIPYGTDLSLFNHIYSIKEKDKKLKILHAGRLTEKKGVLDLTKILIQIKQENKDIDFTYDIIGDGEKYLSIEELISENKCEDWIKMHGSLNHTKLIDEMLKCDIFILNSRISSTGDMEGFPNTIIEAMAAKCAVISTYHAGIPEAIDNNINGVLVEEKNNEQLKQAILSVITDDKFRNKLKEQAYIKANNSFSIQQMYSKYYELYEKKCQ